MEILGIHRKKREKIHFMEKNCSILIENFPFSGKFEAKF